MNLNCKRFSFVCFIDLSYAIQDYIYILSFNYSTYLCFLLSPLREYIVNLYI